MIFLLSFLWFFCAMSAGWNFAENPFLAGVLFVVSVIAGYYALQLA